MNSGKYVNTVYTAVSESSARAFIIMLTLYTVIRTDELDTAVFCFI